MKNTTIKKETLTDKDFEIIKKWIKFNSGKPSPYMYKRQRKIMRLMKQVPVFPPKDEKKKE